MFRLLLRFALVAVMLLLAVAPLRAEVCLRDTIYVTSGCTTYAFDKYTCESGTHIYYAGSYDNCQPSLA